MKALTAGLLSKGAYVLKDFGEDPKLILMATGSEVSLIYEAAQKLFAEGTTVRVVSFPSWELFEEQDEAYRDSSVPEKYHGATRCRSRSYTWLGTVRQIGARGFTITARPHRIK